MLVASLQLLDSSPVPTGHAALHEVNEQISALVTSLPTSKEPRRSSSRTSGLPGRCEQGMQQAQGPRETRAAPTAAALRQATLHGARWELITIACCPGPRCHTYTEGFWTPCPGTYLQIHTYEGPHSGLSEGYSLWRESSLYGTAIPPFTASHPGLSLGD